MKNIYKDITNPGTITGQVFFLLLGIPRTVSELSKCLYNGKVQLTHINRVIDKLESNGHIEQVQLTREERRNKKIDLRAKYWKAKTDILVDYCDTRINSRITDKKNSDHKNDISEIEKKALKIIFDSDWFSSFFKNEYLINDIDIDIREGECLRPSDPFHFLGFTIEEIGAISFFINIKIGLIIKPEDIVKAKDFDKFVKNNIDLMTKGGKNTISKTIKNSKRQLGNYKETNLKLDYMIEGYNIFFIPNELASKLTRVGRIPLTLSYSLR